MIVINVLILMLMVSIRVDHFRLTEVLELETDGAVILVLIRGNMG